MASRKEIVSQARTWLGTPFKHQGRVKGVGVDCVGLIIGVAKELKISNFDTKDYSKVPDVKMMGNLLLEHLNEIAINEAKEGDIFWMIGKTMPQHLSIKTDKGIIHSTSKEGRCVEHSLDAENKQKIYKAFKYKGIK